MHKVRTTVTPTLKVFQFSSVTQSCPTLCDPMNRSSPGLPVHHQLLEFTQTHVHQVGDAIQPFHPLSSPPPPAPNPSQHQSLFQESTLRMRWPKYWRFIFSIIPSKEHPGLISFRMDWLGLLAVQGTLKSLLQHHRLGTCYSSNTVTERKQNLSFQFKWKVSQEGLLIGLVLVTCLFLSHWGLEDGVLWL